MADNYDTPWKNTVRAYFPEFMAFYFPAAHADINWTQPIEFLDQELAQLATDAVIGPRRVDNLVRVSTLSSPEQAVLVHVEVQNWPGRNFAERIFIYNYRIYDRHRGPVASMAVTADSGLRSPPNRFGYEAFGCSLWLDFAVVSLARYARDLDHLLQSNNPFAFLTAAHVLALRTRLKHDDRYAAKLHLIEQLYERNWDSGRTMDFARAIGWMMRLPAEMETSLWQEIEQKRKEHAVEYLLPFEREALEKGLQKGLLEGLEKGLEKGIEEGLQQGRQRGQAELIARQASKRFGPLPDSIQQRLAEASTEQLGAWADALLGADTLDDIFGPQQTA
ncbi:DUF4351 domain-containing protein [Massilia sp. Root418]|uniref:DUF4351 domain-containing protein n=1 Tax=Massilia sp. Root418 TaxID=1736532 RepID=UPI000B161900|nr:DUF4351 domain-containing protein [Massilia sp. Root418]